MCRSVGGTLTGHNPALACANCPARQRTFTTDGWLTSYGAHKSGQSRRPGAVSRSDMPCGHRAQKAATQVEVIDLGDSLKSGGGRNSFPRANKNELRLDAGD
jgi:hypothetical protein